MWSYSDCALLPSVRRSSRNDTSESGDFVTRETEPMLTLAGTFGSTTRFVTTEDRGDV
ncbi:MAG: hypothetical protein IV100_02965 [Myxococcales bacterium]|nr:hypothetical protein [Myxococcales bacterium]